MTRPTLHSAAAASRRPGGWRRICADGARLLASFVLGIALAGCDSGGGSTPGDGSTGGGGSGDVPLATEPVDLPPGQTAVQVAWEASRGVVTGYAIFLSRNGDRFAFERVEPEPHTIIEGQPGDEVRVLVTALSDSDNSSEPSPPSVPIRFYAASTAAGSPSLPPVGAGTDPASPAPASSPSEPAPAPAPESTPVPAAPPDPTPDPAPSPSDPTPPTDPPTEPASHELTSDLRLRLLMADVRLPIGERSEEAAAWIRAWLGATSLADLIPIGTPLRPGDGQRDLVWRDASGQLYLTDGPALAASPPESWIATPTLTLGPDERWVELADVDGDLLRDWLIEDRTTGEVFYQIDAQTPARTARAADQPASDRLVGCGDLDGDGRVELLWEGDDGALSLARPSGRLPAFAEGAWPPPGARVIALADLTGDGRDDLIARHPDGRIAYGIAVDDGLTGALAIGWSDLLAEAAAGAELIATLDEDGDGRAALVWLSGGLVEIRGPLETVPRAF